MEYMLETKHLRIRKFRSEDVENVYKNHFDEEVWKWIPDEYYNDFIETKNAIEFYNDCVNRNIMPFVLAVELRETSKLIGDIGVNQVEGHPDEIEIAYVIGKEYRGNGYATEVVTALSDYFVKVFNLNVIYGRVLHGNIASRRVLEKTGYIFVKEEFNALDDPYGNGVFVYIKNNDSFKKR